MIKLGLRERSSHLQYEKRDTRIGQRDNGQDLFLNILLAQFPPYPTTDRKFVLVNRGL